MLQVVVALLFQPQPLEALDMEQWEVRQVLATMP